MLLVISTDSYYDAWIDEYQIYNGRLTVPGTPYNSLVTRLKRYSFLYFLFIFFNILHSTDHEH